MTDKVQLEMKPEPGSIDLARTALLMIDMQVMYMNINTKIHDYYDYYYYDYYYCGLISVCFFSFFLARLFAR